MANTGLTMLTAILILSACGFLDVCAQGFCPENWVHWEESCYAFVDDLTSWTAAKTICLSLKADLVQIESAEENTFLTQIVQQRKAVGVWIGLDDFVQEGRWVLSSSQEVPPLCQLGSRGTQQLAGW
ncbi:C-type lectin domain family 2 member D-like [Pomacea canaliculata]|uniref:C-type lectin domain family 2 member D-like n=1 Tax=Pomacea canaliculata TaxID=400727 RepID=UPI000D73B4ED|nr:C-type lectin domain family 2 member D-like [Pomacea canaliculata]